MDSQISSTFRLLFVLLFGFLQAASAENQEGFLECLRLYSQNPASISNVTYTPINSSYSSVLNSSIQNLRFFTPTTPKPRVIVTALNVSHIQTTIICARIHGLQIRTRSGGHDYEGLSFVSDVPFVILDLFNIRDVTIDEENSTAWIQAGATLGEIYYRIGEKTRTLGFPAGVCAGVGSGGHFSGGGYGFLMRKYGLAADQVIDAQLIDVKGRVLDRNSMGEDLFWAIRGGGGASFGVIVAWKVKLVPVPSTVTVFSITRTLEQNATNLAYKWQSVAPKLPGDITLRLMISRVNSTEEGEMTIRAAFDAFFLGTTNGLLQLMQERFPELNATRQDCTEVSWIQSVLYFAEFSIESVELLLNRVPFQTRFKAKSDYVKEPIPVFALEGLWERLFEEEAATAILLFAPYGARMAEISESSTPFPHRAGVLYKLHYWVGWQEEDYKDTQKYISWIRRLYSYMAPYVSKNPREAYINYRDLDIGTNNKGKCTSYKQAKIWGEKYFKNNFDRLVRVKTEVDPSNFFRNEQSIPPISSYCYNSEDDKLSSAM
ncbi:berberine bridge enzyme-like 18 [Tripterygium wilfordii]|uniref:berberine bridge enzyme-like 18 n=1 Tax=Tripterygium wilfordii TaxID=458696 RepID=UPI0018F861B0|nr:berberine bridge enzyme-like 18 [Tripterygium wilfordii]